MNRRYAVLVFAVVACVAQAFAARNIVYVSFNGSDANACTVAAPCKTISHALTVVAAGGEVDIISSGTYDNFIVNKAVTVAAAPGVLASSDVPANTNGITIAAGASDIVNLRNLHLNGLGSFATAIQVNSLGQLNMEDCIVRNLRDGISFTPGNTSSTLRINGGILDLAVTPYTGFSIYTESGGNMNVDRVNVYNGVPDAISVQQQNSVFTVTRSFLIGCGGCSGSGFPSSLATFFFARERSGIAMREAQAKRIPGTLCAGAFRLTRSEMDS
jgi:hypothetical protein